MGAPYLSPDDHVLRLFTLLDTIPTKPAGLKVLNSDLLPTEGEEMPVCGVYLVEDKLGEKIDPQTTDRQRLATVRLELRTIGEMLSNRTFRDWAVTTVLNDLTLRGMCTRPVEFLSFQPFGLASDHRYAGADLDFLVTYDFSVPGGLYA